uniref:G-protein coupled receptors family 1 profile domain-containing protein n=1 Tax=Panagrolaimus sp. PS1159 TaxID=55785 RepID=A0AC35F3X3_9BILA
MRYAASISNVFIGAFLLKLVRKKIVAKNALTKKNNRLAVVTLLMALLLDFLPHLVNFSLNTFKDINITKYLGPYSLLFASINTSICAMTYFRTIRKQSISNIKQFQTNQMYPTSTQPSKK